MEENHYTAPLRLPDPPRKGVPWLTVDTSPTALYGNKPSEAVERKYFGNTSPPPSLCSCGNCADYPDAVDNNAEILDDKTPDIETLNDYHQAKRDAAPRGKRPRAKLNCLYADKRYMSDPELDAVVRGPPISFKTMEQVEEGPTEAFPVFIDGDLKVHDYFACHFGVPNPQEPNKDDNPDEKASNITRRRCTYPKTPAPICRRTSTGTEWEPDLDFVLDSAVQTAKNLQAGAEDMGEIARRLEGQIAIVKIGISSNKPTWAGTSPHHPLSPLVTVLFELSFASVVTMFTIVLATAHDVYTRDDLPAVSSCGRRTTLPLHKVLLAINVGITMSRVLRIVGGLLVANPGAKSTMESEVPARGMTQQSRDTATQTVGANAEKQVDSSAIIDDDGF